MKLAIYNRGIPFDGRTPFSQPLGGSETSIVHMGRELARQGHEVTVYSVPSSAGALGAAQARQRPIDGVSYRPCEDFFTDCASSPWDALISFRSFDPFLIGRVAPRMIFWTGDAADQPALQNFAHPALQQNIDLIFCVSNWHRRSFIDAFALAPDRVIATRNGFCPELVPKSSHRDWTRCAYSSTPFRGLEVLLKMFPYMRQRVPTLRLDVFSSMKVYGWSNDADQQAFGALYKAAAQPGVTWHGGIAQPRLMENLSRSGLFLYPNTFAETSCMAAIEAQACGAVVITTARAALSETVENGKSGICIPGEPDTPAYQSEFITTSSNLLQSPSRLMELSEGARSRAFRLYPWSSVALEWSDILRTMPVQPVHARWNGPLVLLQKTHDYLENGNINAASRVLATLDRTPFLKNEVEKLKGRLAHGRDDQRQTHQYTHGISDMGRVAGLD
jgi:glycosyltransferase involved in cell wall biosynthesis